MGQQERAIKCYQEALKVDPKQYAVRFNLGIAYMQANQYEPARRELAKVVAAQPNNLRAHYLLGLCLLKQGRLPEGTAELERVRRANAKDLDVSYTLASAYLKANQLDKAEPIVTGLETVDSAEAHYIVGSYYLAKFDHHRAVRELEMAVKQNPKLPEAHSQLAYAYFFDFKWDLSVKMCEEELPYTPTTGTLSNCWVRSIGRGDDWMRQPRFWTRRPAKARTTPRFCIKSDFSLRPRTTIALQWPFLRRSPS
jgi:tetratricopeptide (TPR) repeat protein